MDQHMFLLAADPLAWDVRIRLSILHFLEFGIWGAWFVVLGNYLNSLNFSRKDIGRIYATMSLGSVIAPMFVGTIADRYFSSELILGILHLAGAVLLYVMSQLKTPRSFYWAALAYAMVYAPTLFLSTSLTFAHVPDGGRDFPTVRVLGTIGWIAAGMSLSLFIPRGQQVNNRPLLLASVLSLILGVYSFFLPETPPPAAGAGAQAEAVLGLGDIAVVNAGHDYQSAPSVTIEGGGGAGAEAKANITGGKVTSIDVTKSGRGFTSKPTIKIEGGGGAGASGSAIVDIVSVQVLQEGSGYRTPPSIGVIGGGGNGAIVKAKLKDDKVTSIDVVKGGGFYNDLPALVFPTAEIPFIKAIALFKDRSFAVFFGVSFLITLALAFYFSFTALFLEKSLHVKPQYIGTYMSIGQWVEIIFMFTLPWFVRELGMRGVLAIGMAAWGLRYLLFATRGPLPFILLGIALHGICFDFFFAAGFIHVNNAAPPDIQASGQSLFGVLTYGLGMWLGTEASGWLNQYFTHDVVDPQTGAVEKVTDWTKFWLVPAIGVLISLALFLLLF